MKTLPLHPAPQDAFNGLIESLATRLAEEARAEMRTVIAQEIGKLKDFVVERPLSVKEAAADYMGIHEDTLYKWISTGEVPPSIVHKTTGGRYFFFPSELHAFIKSL